MQDDLCHAGLKPDPYFGRNAEACGNTDRKRWVYEGEFDAPTAGPAAANPLQRGFVAPGVSPFRNLSGTLLTLA
jgi:hypothetical protein